MPAKPSQPDGWDNKAKLAAVIEAALMNEAERSTYCRKRGLYVEQLDAWKAAFEQASGAMVSPAMLAARTKLYEAAKAAHPDRWRGRAVRNWEPVGPVHLNPDRATPVADEPERLAA